MRLTVDFQYSDILETSYLIPGTEGGEIHVCHAIIHAECSLWHVKVRRIDSEVDHYISSMTRKQLRRCVRERAHNVRPDAGTSLGVFERFLTMSPLFTIPTRNHDADSCTVRLRQMILDHDKLQ